MARIVRHIFLGQTNPPNWTVNPTAASTITAAVTTP
jgi:hypothetical protein